MGKSEYCMPCGEKGNPVFATETVDGEPMCRGCAGVAEKQRKRQEEALAAKDPAPAVEKPRRVKPKKEPKLCSQGCGQMTHRGHCRRALGPFEGETQVQTIGMRMEQRLTVHEPIELVINPDAPTLAESIVNVQLCEEVSVEELRAHYNLPMGHVPLLSKSDAVELIGAVDALQGKPPLETVAGLKAQRVTFEDIPALVVFRKPRGRVVELWEQLVACTAEAPVLKLECESIRKAGQLMPHLRARAKKFGKAIDSRRDAAVLYVWLVEMEKTA